jgi:hypothetical protein
LPLPLEKEHQPCNQNPDNPSPNPDNPNPDNSNPENPCNPNPDNPNPDNPNPENPNPDNPTQTTPALRGAKSILALLGQSGHLSVEQIVSFSSSSSPTFLSSHTILTPICGGERFVHLVTPDNLNCAWGTGRKAVFLVMSERNNCTEIFLIFPLTEPSTLQIFSVSLCFDLLLSIWLQ